MRYLLDTHILIWVLKGETSFLSNEVKNLIEDASNDIFYSSVSVWEVAIKYAIKPESLGVSAENLVKLCVKAKMKELTLAKEHIFELDSLKLAEEAPKHKDPFDRILIAQAKRENMIFISHDSKFKWYNEKNIMII